MQALLNFLFISFFSFTFFWCGFFFTFLHLLLLFLFNISRSAAKIQEIYSDFPKKSRDTMGCSHIHKKLMVSNVNTNDPQQQIVDTNIRNLGPSFCQSGQKKNSRHTGHMQPQNNLTQLIFSNDNHAAKYWRKKMNLLQTQQLKQICQKEQQDHSSRHQTFN